MEHILIDCSTGEEKRLTHEEAVAHPDVAIGEDHAKELASLAKAQAAAEKQRGADLAMVRKATKDDPVLAALTRLLGQA